MSEEKLDKIIKLLDHIDNVLCVQVAVHAGEAGIDKELLKELYNKGRKNATKNNP